MMSVLNAYMSVTKGNGRTRRSLVVIALTASAGLVLFSLLIIPYLTTHKSQESDFQRRIISFEGTDLRYVKAGDLSPNSFVWIFNPFDPVVASELYKKPVTSLTENEKNEAIDRIDRHAYYLLIRVPEWLGGDQDNTSAYRAYSGISLSQKCLARYWPQDGRMRIEDPCAGDIYRSWDGLAYGGPAGQGFSGGTISRGKYQGLATLDLAIDGEDYILALKPDINPGSNGIAGEGRLFSPEELQESNQKLMAASSSYVGYALPFIETISSDYRLADIRESYQFVDSGDMNSGPASAILEAVFVDHRSYEGITITSAPIDRLPPYAVERLTKNVNGIIVPQINNTDLRSLLGIYDVADDNCYFTSDESTIKVPYSIKYGAGIAGTYAIFHAPDFSAMREQSPSVDDNFSCGGHAVIWGKSAAGEKDLFVWIQTVGQDLDQLASLARSLPIS